MNERPTPYVLLPTPDPVDRDRASRDLVAVPLTPEVLERVTHQALQFLRVSNETGAQVLAFDLPEAVWYEGYHPERGWMPAEMASDPTWEEEFDVEAEVPGVIQRVALEEEIGLAREDALETLDATSHGARLVFGNDVMYVQVGPGTVGTYLTSDPLPEAVLLWASLYWELGERPDVTFRALAEIDPTMALDLLEFGFRLEGAASATHLSFGPVGADALAPLLESEERDVRTRAVLLAARHVGAADAAAAERGRRRG